MVQVLLSNFSHVQKMLDSNHSFKINLIIKLRTSSMEIGKYINQDHMQQPARKGIAVWNINNLS